MIRRFLKRIPAAAALNARIKCRRMKQEYERLCRRYGTPSILSEPRSIAALTAKLWATGPAPRPGSRRLRVLFVGTDEQQDRSGMLQAIARATEVTVFQHEPGRHGQRWPRTAREMEAVREHNGAVLRRYLAHERFDLIIGQMWGLSMHWKALAEARAKGTDVVNIAMDDRNTFTVSRFSDGTEAGTRGIAPYLSLACTDAAECVAWYEAEGCRAIYFPEASDPEIFFPGEEHEDVDVSFVGARYGIREQLVAALRRAGVAVEAYGAGWPNGRIAGESVTALMRRSRMILGCGTIGHCPDFVTLKLRDFDSPMSGKLYVTHANPDLEPLFDVGREVVTFAGVEELVEKVRHFLDDDEARQSVAGAGRLRCLRDHTWDGRIAALLEALSSRANPVAQRLDLVGGIP